MLQPEADDFVHPTIGVTDGDFIPMSFPPSIPSILFNPPPPTELPPEHVAYYREFEIDRSICIGTTYEDDSREFVVKKATIPKAKRRLAPGAQGGVKTRRNRIKDRVKRNTGKPVNVPAYACEINSVERVKHLSDVELKAAWPEMPWAKEWTIDVWELFTVLYHKTKGLWGERFTLQKVTVKFANVQRAYGLTSLQWMKMWADSEGLCCICGDDMIFWAPSGEGMGDKLAVVDHNHHNHQIRRLLSAGCNKGLGSLKDDPKVVARALVYLQSEGNYAVSNVDLLRGL